MCTPIGQAEELYRGIADAGNAEVELVVYPREGYGITERAHQLDFWERARGFFDGTCWASRTLWGVFGARHRLGPLL